jgi:hypothetical protein
MLSAKFSSTPKTWKAPFAVPFGSFAGRRDYD